MRFPIKTVLAVALVVSVIADLNAADAPPPETIDGLVLVPDTQMDLVYAAPGADLGGYGRIYLLEPQISFVKGYKRKQNSIQPNSVNDEDMQRMKSDLAELFREVFEQELQNNAGYVLVDGVAEDVLAVRPAIIDLDVQSPELTHKPNTRSLVASVGQMTLYLELIDSVSGDVLVKALDNQYDRTRVKINVRNKDRNEDAARKILSDWAILLREAIDEARLRD